MQIPLLPPPRKLTLPIATLAIAAFSSHALAAGTPLATLLVDKEGIQEVSLQALADASVTIPEGDLNRFSVEYRGTPVPVQIVLAEDNSVEAIRFWGDGIGRHKDIGRHSSANAYLLTIADEDPPRVEVFDPGDSYRKSQPADLVPWTTARFETENSVTPFLADEEHEDYYFGPSFGPRPSTGKRSATAHFSTENRNDSVDAYATIRVGVFGRSSLIVDPDHLLILDVNGTRLGETTFDGSTSHVYEAVFPVDTLRSWGNELVIDAPGSLKEARRVSPGRKDQNGLAAIAFDAGYLDWFEVVYPITDRTREGIYEMTRWVADTDDPIVSVFRMKGFSSPDVVTWDLTNGRAFLPLDSSISYEHHDVRAVVRLEPDTHLWATARQDLPRPRVRPFHTGDPAAVGAAHQVVILTHPDFRPAAERLAAHRTQRGTMACVLDVDALYDHYNHGLKSPETIREFVTDFRQRPASRTESLVLLGCASYDTKGLFPDEFAPDFIPAIYTPAKQYPPTASDNLLTAESIGSAAPTFPIGRLPARSPEQAMLMVNKIVTFEEAEGASWKRRMLFSTGEQTHFKNASDSTIETLSKRIQELEVTRIYPDQKEELNFNVYADRFAESFSRGNSFVTFIGHGGSTYWRFNLGGGTVEFMNMAQIAAFANKGMPSIVYGGTCYTNKFDIERDESICLRLLGREDAGAVAIVSTSHRMALSDCIKFQDVFARELIDTDNRTLGQAFLSAFTRTPLTRHSKAALCLLGDPSMDITSMQALALENVSAAD